MKNLRLLLIYLSTGFCGSHCPYDTKLGGLVVRISSSGLLFQSDKTKFPAGAS